MNNKPLRCRRDLCGNNKVQAYAAGKAVRFAILIPLVLVFVGMAVSACSIWPFARSDDLAPYRLAMQPHAQSHLDQAASAPRYDISVRIDTENLTVVGREAVWFVNDQAEPLNELFFRLYPNLPAYGGDMQVGRVEIDQKELNASYEADRTALRIALPYPLRPKQRMEIMLDFRVKVKRKDEGRVLFGESRGILSLPNFYPMVAMRRDGSWDLSVGPEFADAVYSDIALYQVAVDAPKGMTIAGTGVAIDQKDTPDGRQVTRFVAGPARDFGLIMSPLFQKQTMTVRNVVVNSYHLPQDASGGYSALWRAATALQVYSDVFSEYPYTKLDVVEAPLEKRGMEYPALILIGVEVYRTEKKRLEPLVVHETAHQWWYNLVGSDPVNEPAVDEGLAEYSLNYYYENLYGKRYAQQVIKTRWLEPLAYIRESGLDAPVMGPASSFNKDNYETIVYAKSSALYEELRQYIGDDAFNSALRSYLSTYQYRVAPTGAFLALASGATTRDITAYAAKWQEPLPTPSAQ